MVREEMIIACCTDIAGKIRGKAFPAVQFDKRVRRGIGWTPTNVQITCFDTIAESPFGSLGDLVLIPDEAARVRVGQHVVGAGRGATGVVHPVIVGTGRNVAIRHVRSCDVARSPTRQGRSASAGPRTRVSHES